MRRPLVEELLAAPDPAEACERLAFLPYRLFLDSTAGSALANGWSRLGRYSFLAADPAMLVWSKGASAEIMHVGEGRSTRVERHALSAVRELLRPYRADPVPGLPPFQGGAAGYIGYDWGAVLERLPSPRFDDLAIPDVMLGLYDWVIAWDHAERRCWLISTGMPASGRAREKRAAERLGMVRRLLEVAPGNRGWERSGIVAPHVSLRAAAPSYPVENVEHAAEIGLRSSFTHAGYLDAVARVREYILAGDIFQANLSQRFEAPLREPVWSLYRRLRASNPAPFSAFLDYGDVQVLSASPERFLGLPDGRTVEARPIKGTRPRGVGPEHDAALGQALAESDKDRAENLMIVDLLRNDLSRVCAPGTVRAPEVFALEHYATVHHLVSTVTGELEAGRDAVDLLEATFPGGSITGAPKVRAMEIIAELEPSRRGVYCGSIGYLSASGAMDTSIVIRTFLARHGRVYFSAGGGIVADSDPGREYDETVDKARALIAALASAPASATASGPASSPPGARASGETSGEHHSRKST